MVIRIRTALVPSALAALGVACNVSATSTSTGGVGDGGDDAGGTCDQGAVVLLTDYMSTQIALSALDGTTRSASFLSTASTKASGDAFPLSGDVVLPRTTPPSGRVVLIDSAGTDVITWADPATAHVYAQLPVGTGFDSDPWDYLEVDATRAYVTRWDVNDAPGMQPFDSGSDVLILDTMTPAIIGSIPMPVEDALPPRPASMLRVGDTVIVVLQRMSEDFSTVGESALVGIQNDAIAWEMHVTGFQTCDHPTLSPSGHTMAIACEGQLAVDGTVMNPAATGIVLYDVTTPMPTLAKHFRGGRSDRVAGPDRGHMGERDAAPRKDADPGGGATDNQAFTLDLGTGKGTVLLTAGTDAMGKGKGLVYGDVLCRPGCGDVCLLADADVGKLRRWNIVNGGCSRSATSRWTRRRVCRHRSSVGTEGCGRPSRCSSRGRSSRRPHGRPPCRRRRSRRPRARGVERERGRVPEGAGRSTGGAGDAPGAAQAHRVAGALRTTRSCSSSSPASGSLA